MEVETNSSVAYNFAPPPKGTYVPAVTLFDQATDRLALDAQKKYFAYLSRTGLTGLVINGTNAEPMLLTREERKELLVAARQSAPKGYPLVAGVSGHSTAQVLEYVADAYDAGSDYLLLMPCAYFGKATTPDVVHRFYDDVARVSPLPIILYNFPGVCNGLDLDSDTITAIVKRNPSVVGVKLTCGSVAKIARLSGTFKPSRFATFGGQSDFLLGGLAVGAAGCVAAFGNTFPKSVARLYRLKQAGRDDEALVLQLQLALAEAPTKSGVAATKYAACISSARRAGITDESLFAPRRPYGPLSERVKADLRARIGPYLHLEDDAKM